MCIFTFIMSHPPTHHPGKKEASSAHSTCPNTAVHIKVQELKSFLLNNKRIFQ